MHVCWWSGARAEHRHANFCTLMCVCKDNMCAFLCIFQHYFYFFFLFLLELYVSVCQRLRLGGCSHFFFLCFFFQARASEFTICDAQLILSACIYRGIEHLLKWAWLCHCLLLCHLQEHRDQENEVDKNMLQYSSSGRILIKQ